MKKDHKSLVISQSISLIGDHSFVVALSTFMLLLSGNIITTIWVAALGMLSSLFATLTVNFFKRKYSIIQMMKISDMVRFLILLPTFFINKDNYHYLYLIIIILGYFTALFNSSRDSYIQMSSLDCERIKIITKLQTINSLFELIITPLTGLLIGIINIKFFMLFNSLTYLFSFVYVKKMPDKYSIRNTKKDKILFAEWTYFFNNNNLVLLNINRIILSSVLSVYMLLSYKYINNLAILNETYSFQMVLGVVIAVKGLFSILSSLLIGANKRGISKDIKQNLVVSSLGISLSLVILKPNFFLILSSSAVIGFFIFIARTSIILIGQRITNQEYMQNSILIGDLIARGSSIIILLIAPVFIELLNEKIILLILIFSTLMLIVISFFIKIDDVNLESIIETESELR